jgi:predicted translin family RNA/ssDNA-binding protein
MARPADEAEAIAAIRALRRQQLERAEQRLARVSSAVRSLKAELATRRAVYEALESQAAACRAAQSPYMASLIDEPVRKSLHEAARVATRLVLAEASELAARRHMAKALRASEIWSAIGAEQDKLARRQRDAAEEEA